MKNFAIICLLLSLCPDAWGTFTGASTPNPWGDAGGGLLASAGTEQPEPEGGDGADTSSTGIEGECEWKEYTEPYVSLNFLRSISSGISYDNFSINKNGALEGSIKLGEYVNACFEPRMVTRKVGNNIFIRIKNVYFEDGSKCDDSCQSLPNIDEKYKACMNKEGLIEEDRSNGKWSINVKKAIDEGKHIGSGGRLEYNLPEEESRIDLDPNETYHLFFGSNAASKTKASSAKGDTVEKHPGWKCAAYRRVSTSEIPLHKGKIDILAEEARKYCRDPSLTSLKDILDMDPSATGNGREIISVLESVMIRRLDGKQKDIFDKMRTLESAMRTLLKKSRKNKGGDTDDFDEDPEKVAKEYRKLIDQLEKEVYKPALRALEKLHEGYDELGEEEQKERKKRIFELTKMLSELSKNKKKRCSGLPCTFYRRFNIYERLGGVDDDAKKFEELRVASKYYSRVHKESRKPLHARGKIISLKRAEHKIAGEVRVMDQSLDWWHCQGETLDGDSTCVREYRAKINSARKARQKLEADGPFKGLGMCKYISSRYCNRRKQSRLRVFQFRRASSDQRIQHHEGRMGRLGKLYDVYEERREREAEDGFDDDYGDFDYLDYNEGIDFNLFGPSRGRDSYLDPREYYYMQSDEVVGPPLPSSMRRQRQHWWEEGTP